KSIDSTCIRLDQIVPAKLKRVDAKVMRNFIHVYLHGVAWLRRAMPTLWATRWLIGKETHTLEFISGQFVRHRLQCTRIIGGCYTVGAVVSAVEKRAKVHGGQRAGALDAGVDPHFNRMPSLGDLRH